MSPSIFQIKVQKRVKLSHSIIIPQLLGFYDLECSLASEGEAKQCPDCVFNCKCENSFTIEKNKHKPIIYSFCIVSTDGQLLWEKSKKCPNGDAHIKLLEELLSIEKRLLEKTNRYIPMNRLNRAERAKLCQRIHASGRSRKRLAARAPPQEEAEKATCSVSC